MLKLNDSLNKKTKHWKNDWKNDEKMLIGWVSADERKRSE